MIKKTIFGSLAGLLVMGFLFGGDAISYATSSLGWVRTSVKNSVPVSLQIERAREMVQKIQPEVYRNKQLIVREEVQLERLADRISAIEGKQIAEKKNILRMKDDLGTGDRHIYYASTRYSREQVEVDLSNRFRRYKTRSEELDHLRAQYTQQAKLLETAHEKLDKMLNSRSQLVAEIAKLEAQEKMVSVAKSASEFAIDDSQLARASELIRDIEARLTVDQRMLQESVEFAEEIPVDEPAAEEDLHEQIAQYFADEACCDSETDTFVAEAEIDIELTDTL
ncbi:MAG: hypothetical protein KDB27_08920 [Planctomycetales bacterium]|nr:hypothetical protein [Planctomycetales bacterium]